MNYKAALAHVNENNMRIMQHAPEVGGQFMQFYQKAAAGDALDTKHKALVALGISISLRCEGCIVMHVQSAIQQGATIQEISDVVDVALLMGGGPAMVHGGKAIEAAEEFLGL